MSHASRSLRPNRARNMMRFPWRALFRTTLLAGVGLASLVPYAGCLLAQDVNNSSTLNLQTNAVERSVDTYNNLSTGVLNFNGPSGAAEWSAGNLIVNNAGQVNLVRSNLGIIGDVTNTGQFHIAPLGGIVQVDGHFVNSGAGGFVLINGGGMELIGDIGGGTANFTNNATNATGLSIQTNRFLTADTITNGSGAYITNLGRLEGRDAIVNSGTLYSNAATSLLKGNVTNHGTIDARGAVEGNVTNSAARAFNVTGNLTQSGNLTNAGTLAVSGGNLTGTDQLTNSSTITISDGRTVSANDVQNNSGGAISVGVNSILTGSELENRASITVGSGGTLRSTSTVTGDDLTNSSSGTITFNGSSGTAVLSSGTGRIVNQGAINLNAGTVLVSGNLADSGTVVIANGATFRTGSVNQSIANGVTLGGVSTFDTNGFDAIVTGNINGSGGLTKSGVGNLTLEGTNTFSGATRVNAGQLTLKGGNALSNSNAVTVGAVGSLKIQDTETIGSLAGDAGGETTLAAELRTGGNHSSTTYSGRIVGTNRMVKEGTGTMTLAGSNANTFSGGVVVENGTLVASTNEQLGTGIAMVGPNGTGAAGTLQIDVGTTQTVDGVEIGSESGTGAPRGIINNSGRLNSQSNISNAGTINNLLATSVVSGGITNRVEEAIINNQGTINGGVINDGGSVQNGTAGSVINGGLENLAGVVNNTGTINGGVLNLDTINSNTGTSAIAGGLTNRNSASLRNQVRGAIVNENSRRIGDNTSATITVAGDLVGDNALLNKDTSKVHVKDGNFTGITTLTNQSTNAAGIEIDATRTLGAAAVTNQYGSTIVNSGTLQSGSVVNNGGTITNQSGAAVVGGIENTHAGSLVTNNGTIHGGITQNVGTVNSLNSNSVIHGGVNNSAYINARGQISGAVVNNAQHSFTDVTLTHIASNAAGTVVFGTGASEQSFNLAVTGGSAGGAEGNGQKNVTIVFDADPDQVGTSRYDPDSDSITVYVAGETSTNVQDIQTAINNGSGFTASGGTPTGTIESNGLTDTLAGGRDSGTALIRILADATGSAAQSKQVAIINDPTISADSAVALVDSATGNIMVKVNGEVGYSQIAVAIDNLSGFQASVATSMGDQAYDSTVDTPPIASTLSNGIFNVEGNLVVDNTFTNGGHLNLNNGDLTGITTLSNSGDVVVQDGYTLQASTINNQAGAIVVGHDSVLHSTGSLNNDASIRVDGRGVVASDGTITNNASGTIDFGLGSTASSDVSELYSDTNSIVNNGLIDVNNGVLLTTGNVTGSGTVSLSNQATFRTGNTNQNITNNLAIAGGSATFDTNGNNASVSGTVSGSGQLRKSGAGNLALSGNNTFTGPATIDGGQVTLQGGNAIANTTHVQLNSGSLVISSAETIGSLATSSGTQTTLNANLTTGGNHSSTTSSGRLSGTGGLAKQGAGSMTLNGSVANTYAGGTTVSGGTLNAATNEQLGTGSVTVGNGASLVTGNGTTQSVSGVNNQGTMSLGSSSTLNTGAAHFINSGTVQVGTNGSIIDTGTITNSGAIHFSGGTATLSSGTNLITNTGSINLNAGTVLVKGNLVGNGTINMNNGTTLRSGNANQQIANGIAVNSGTAVIDTNGNNVNLTGNISGSGALNKVGNGSLTWVGVNNGNALINSGVMITSTQSQVGNIQITNGSGVVFDQSTNGNYSGSVTGNGSLTKSGSGTVTMTGNSAYSGGTSVLSGTLRVGNHGTGQLQSNVNVGSSGTLGGGGTIVGNVATQQGGRVAAGNSIGTLNISGNLNAAGSTIENELNGTVSDFINVTGTAAIAGATLENQFDPLATYATRLYRVLNATGGVSGQFANVTQVRAPSNFLISTYYTPTTANVSLTSIADATLASSTSTSLLSSGQDYLTTFMDQVNGYQLSGLGMAFTGNPVRPQRNVWFKGVGFFSDAKGVGVAPGYTANTGGGIVGIDRALAPNTRVGVAGGYTFTDLGIRNAARSNADINSARVHLYGAHSWELVTLTAIGGYTHHDVESKRRLVGIGTAVGSQAQHESSANLQMMVNPTDETFSLLPYVGVQWVQISQQAYTERGTPGFDMTVAKASVESLRPYIGARFQYRMASRSGLLAVPYLFARYSRETVSDSHLSNVSINGSRFLVAGVQPNLNIVGLGGGINARLRQNIDWYATYDVNLGDRSTNQNAAAGFEFKF